MNTTPTDEVVLKQDVLGRVKTPKARREQLLDEFERSGLRCQCGEKYPRSLENPTMNQPRHNLPPSPRLRRDKYDHSAAIRLQITMAVRSNVQKPCDASSANSTMPKSL